MATESSTARFGTAGARSTKDPSAPARGNCCFNLRRKIHLFRTPRRTDVTLSINASMRKADGTSGRCRVNQTRRRYRSFKPTRTSAARGFRRTDDGSPSCRTTRACPRSTCSHFRDQDAGCKSPPRAIHRSEEHTSELQSRPHLVCRLLLEKKKKIPEHTSAPHLIARRLRKKKIHSTRSSKRSSVPGMKNANWNTSEDSTVDTLQTWCVSPS